MLSDKDWESCTAEEVLREGADCYGPRIGFASSFGAEDVVIIHMLAQIAPEIDIFFLDTDLHFEETYATIKRLENVYQRSFTQVKTDLTLEEQSDQYGSELWHHNPDLCCFLRKVQPLESYLANLDAWITGIRREQSPTRAHAKRVEWDHRFHLLKINPIVDWTSDDVWAYIYKHQIPYNPLHDHNYPSIGCTKCTKQVLPGEDLRSGRWNGFAKTECGLHK